MKALQYSIAYIDLNPDINDLFAAMKTRTEIRKAEKSGVSFKLFNGLTDSNIFLSCKNILKTLLVKELVPYSDSFDQVMRDKNNFVLVAFINNEVVSFVVLMPRSSHDFFAKFKTAFLGLSATSEFYKNYCPNYLLIWESIKFLKDNNFKYFNLGLMSYQDCPDPDIERVAFFKKKWGIKELLVEDSGNLLKFWYYKYLKKYRFIKFLLYYFKKI